MPVLNDLREQRSFLTAVYPLFTENLPDWNSPVVSALDATKNDVSIIRDCIRDIPLQFTQAPKDAPIDDKQLENLERALRILFDTLESLIDVPCLRNQRARRNVCLITRSTASYQESLT